MSDDTETKNRSLLYSENARGAVAFWEWRHKVMTRFFTAIAATVANGELVLSAERIAS